MPASEGTALHYETPEGLKGRRADARFYRVDPPLPGWDDDTFYEYIIVSAVDTGFTFGGPETYIFPADEFGAALDMMELPGSQRGTLSHEDVLGDLGYTVIETGGIIESTVLAEEAARQAFLAISNKPHDSDSDVRSHD